MQATTLTGFVLKRELNHVNREKSNEHSLFSNCFCSSPAGLKLNAIRPENWILKIKGETNFPLPYWLIISKLHYPPLLGGEFELEVSSLNSLHDPVSDNMVW